METRITPQTGMEPGNRALLQPGGVPDPLRGTELGSRAIAAAGPTVAPAHLGEALAPGRRFVLIVDDEAPIRDLVATAFARYQIPTLVANNGVEALRIYSERPDEIAVVLTDLHMPEMGGLQLISTLRREANPPVIAVMSGWLDPHLRHQLTAEGTACLIAKPFRFSDFDPVAALARMANTMPARTSQAP